MRASHALLRIFKIMFRFLKNDLFNIISTELNPNVTYTEFVNHTVTSSDGRGRPLPMTTTLQIYQDIRPLRISTVTFIEKLLPSQNNRLRAHHCSFSRNKNIY